MVKVIVQQARMTWISNGNSVLSPVVPLLLGAPKYLAGEMSLGSLMQGEKTKFKGVAAPTGGRGKARAATSRR